jgi:hypothetical protein
MYPIVNEAVMKISRCEIDAVKDANNWKFIKNDKKPKMLEQSVYIYKTLLRIFILREICLLLEFIRSLVQIWQTQHYTDSRFCILKPVRY